MQEGSLRCDANVNLHVAQPNDTFLATPIIEVKNLNSFRHVERALKYEAERQYTELQNELGQKWQPLGQPQLFERGGRTVDSVGEIVKGQLKPVPKATVGWDEAGGKTVGQRRKEEAADYRYFPDPDLVPVTVAPAELDRARASLGELPAALRARLSEQYQLAAYDADVITAQGRAFAGYFEALVKHGADAKEAKTWLTNDILQTLNERKQTIGDFPLSAERVAELIREVKGQGFNKQRAREVYAVMLADGTPAPTAIAKLGFKAVADEGQLLEIIRQAIAANPKAVADFKNGKVKAADAIKGAVMRATKGQAQAELLQQLLLRELQQG